MFVFAQTNLQLLGQMNNLGYSRAERERAATVYRFLIPMFAGLYRGTEKPFISHLIGTASILAAQKESIELVLAGMLHAVYMAGDFGFEPGTRQTSRKRRCIEDLAGAEVGEVTSIYDDMCWNTEALKHYLTNVDSLSLRVRSALKMRLANSLEDLLDHGMNFCTGPKAGIILSREMQGELLALAGALTCQEFTDQLELALAQFNRGEVPVNSERFMGTFALVLPPSARRKLMPTARGWVVRRLRRLRTKTRR